MTERRSAARRLSRSLHAGPRTALERARREAGLTPDDLWARCVALGATCSLVDINAFLQGTEEPPPKEHDAIVQALNERLREIGHNAVVRYAMRATGGSRSPDARPNAAGIGPAPEPSIPAVSVVIPTLNEAKNLPYVLDRLPSVVGEVIVVDGRSTDDTVAVALACRPDARIVEQDGIGKGNALSCGFRAVTGDITVMLDADGSTDPAEIPRFVAALLDGADVAKGTRFSQGGGSDDMTFIRRLGNLFFTTAVNRIWRVRYTDLCYGYAAFWTRVLPSLHIDCRGFEVETLINIRIAASGLRVAEVPSFEAKRIHGDSNLHAGRDGTRVLRTIVAELMRPA